MPGRLAVDFGTCNTRLALWDAGRGSAAAWRLPDVSDLDLYPGEDGAVEEVPYIPSLINYDGHNAWIGRQVSERGLTEAPSTFFWMKRYITSRLELPRQVNGRTVRYSEAGADFLRQVLTFASAEVDLAEEEVALSVPVEAYEHYQKWLSGVCEQVGLRRYRLLDEASAAALGYDVGIQAGDVYMVLDFGGGTLDVSVVRVEDETSGGRRCRVLGKAGVDLGGSVVDQWLYQDVLKQANRAPEDVRHLSSLLLLEAERVKRALTDAEAAVFTVTDPASGAVLGKRYTRSAFEDLLDERGLFASLNGAVEQALARSREAGYDRDHIKAVLLVGGSSRIPSVRRAVRQLFGDRVRHHRPLEAVALGAAAFVAGVDFYDHIQHDYALRFYNREKSDHDYRVIVKAGTPYPSEGPVAQLTVKASQDGQEYLGLSIYEVGRRETPGGAQGPVLDLVFDPGGGARLQQCADPEIVRHFWVNEKCPTFIHARPNAKRGDARFPVQFSIDGNKRLCVTVRDNHTGQTLLQDHPVIDLV